MPTYRGTNALSRIKKTTKPKTVKAKTGRRRPRIGIGKRIKRGY